MVLHHLREKEKGWVRSLCFNLAGAITTLIVLLVIASTKFFGGAWMVIMLIPILVFIFTRIYNHYVAVGKELSIDSNSICAHLDLVAGKRDSGFEQRRSAIGTSPSGAILTAEGDGGGVSLRVAARDELRLKSKLSHEW